MINSKKGMEIAVSTVVGLILGALMLFAGVVLLAKVMDNTNNTNAQVMAEMEQRIMDAFDNNDPIYIPRSSFTPKKSEPAIFGIGIQNIYNTTRNFTISVEHGAESNDVGFSYLKEPFVIEPRSKAVVFVTAETKNLSAGKQYSLILEVKHHNGTSYVSHDSKKILYIKK
jgi:hypothetical protein